MHTPAGAAHHHAINEPDGPADPKAEENSVETVVGVALIVVAALLIVFLIRVVQSNMGRS